MTKETNEKLTVDNLIALKAKLESRNIVEFESKSLGGVIEIVKSTKIKFKSIMSKLSEKSSDEEQAHAENKLIYEHIPLLQNKKLHKAFGVKAPYDIVNAVFGENVNELDKITSTIYGFYGYDVEALKKVKKQ